MRRTARVLLTAAVSVAAGTVVLAAGPPAGATGSCAQRLVPNDDTVSSAESSYQDVYGDDAQGDAAVGSPDYGTGVVDLRNSATSGRTRVTEGSFTGLPAPVVGDRFGAAIAYLDLDTDVCHDMAIGAPGAGSGRGAVVLASGSASGLQRDGAVRVAGRTPGEHFGAAIATQETQGSDALQFYVGAPDRTVDGHAHAGAIDVFTVTPTGTGPGRIAYRGSITQDSPHVPGVAETGDRFGSVLALGPSGTLVVGDPDEAVGSARAAGVVYVLFASGASVGSAASTGFVGGTAQAGARFGASVAISPRSTDFGADELIAVGAPGRTADGRTGSGAVQVLDTASTLRLVRTVTQDSERVPGVSEAGDHFGASVALGTVANCDSTDDLDLVVGAPGEDVGSATDAGAVTITSALGYHLDGFDHGVGTWCQFQYTQGHTTIAGLFGAPEKGDQLGASVTLVAAHCSYDRIALKSCPLDAVDVGVPREDVGGIVDAGGIATITVAGAPNVAGGYGYSGGRHAGQRYGSTGGVSSSSLGN